MRPSLDSRPVLWIAIAVSLLAGRRLLVEAQSNGWDPNRWIAVGRPHETLR